MRPVELFLIAVGLAMDAFAVALAAGASGKAGGRRAVFRISFHFALFQFLMPIIGWCLGMGVHSLISSFDHWVAFGILLLVGGHMIRASFGNHETFPAEDPSRGWTLVMLSLATSMDALAVGLSLAMLKVRILYPSIVIGVVTCCFSWLGITMGNRLGARFGKRMEFAGGVILILVGLRILATC